MKKILLLVNPSLQRAGSKRKDIAGAVNTFRAAGATVDVVETELARDAGLRARQGIAEGYDTLVVCGGDGTVFDVIQGMSGSPVSLGIVPMGTGNVLAQNLKIPTGAEAAARALLRACPLRVPLGKITCWTPAGGRSWVFAMSAGVGIHAALMAKAKRSGKNVTGKVAYFLAGAGLLLNYPLQPFEMEVTLIGGAVQTRQVNEALALRVAELNRWKPGGDLTLPFLRLATVSGNSRLRLARAICEALIFSGGSRSRDPNTHAAADYQDVERVVCRPIPGRAYHRPMCIQADGEVLEASCAEFQMAGLDVLMLSAH